MTEAVSKSKTRTELFVERVIARLRPDSQGKTDNGFRAAMTRADHEATAPQACDFFLSWGMRIWKKIGSVRLSLWSARPWLGNGRRRTARSLWEERFSAAKRIRKRLTTVSNAVCAVFWRAKTVRNSSRSCVRRSGSCSVPIKCAWITNGFCVIFFSLMRKRKSAGRRITMAGMKTKMRRRRNDVSFPFDADASGLPGVPDHG